MPMQSDLYERIAKARIEFVTHSTQRAAVLYLGHQEYAEVVLYVKQLPLLPASDDFKSERMVIDGMAVFEVDALHHLSVGANPSEGFVLSERTSPTATYPFERGH